MNQSHLSGKTTQKAVDRLRRKRNLGDENDRLFSAPNDFLGGAQIDFCLARASDPLAKRVKGVGR
jgi:hypothetical protein